MSFRALPLCLVRANELTCLKFVFRISLLDCHVSIRFNKIHNFCSYLKLRSCCRKSVSVLQRCMMRDSDLYSSRTQSPCFGAVGVGIGLASGSGVGLGLESLDRLL